MTPLYVVELIHTPILQQLQWEEALLRADNRNWCLINQGSPPAIVMGISGQWDKLIHLPTFHQAPVPLIKRFSGGGTVFINEQTIFVTFICNTSFVPILPFPEPIMRWTETLYQPLFHPHPFRLQENDYVIGNQKLGGNAQSICKNRWLHHSSLLWDYNPEQMNYLNLPNKTPHYRANRHHHEFLCRAKDYWNHADSFQMRFLQHLNKHFTIERTAIDELVEITKLPHRQATTLLTLPNCEKE